MEPGYNTTENNPRSPPGIPIFVHPLNALFNNFSISKERQKSPFYFIQILILPSNHDDNYSRTRTRARESMFSQFELFFKNGSAVEPCDFICGPSHLTSYKIQPSVRAAAIWSALNKKIRKNFSIPCCQRNKTGK